MKFIMFAKLFIIKNKNNNNDEVTVISGISH